MRILILNPNTSPHVTRSVDAVARRFAYPDTTLTVLQANSGPETIRNRYEELLSAPSTLNLLQEQIDQHEGVIFACYGDHPILYAARELTTKPIVGIAEASMHTACFLGHRFSIITTNPNWVPLLWDGVDRYGLRHRCASIRTLGLSGGELLLLSEQEVQQMIEEESLNALRQDGAEVICLGGAALSGFDRELTQRLQVPVLDGVVCALKILEGLICYGVTTSKWRAFGNLSQTI